MSLDLDQFDKWPSPEYSEAEITALNERIAELEKTVKRLEVEKQEALEECDRALDRKNAERENFLRVHSALVDIRNMNYACIDKDCKAADVADAALAVENKQVEMKAPEAPPAQGWALVWGPKKWHYFIGPISVCGRWGRIGSEHLDDRPNTDNSPDNCAACVKKVAKLRTKKH